MLSIKNCDASQIENLAAFLAQYKASFPDAKLIGAEFYTHHPALEGGKNVFAAYDEAGCIMGFAPLFPAPAGDESLPGDPHHIWMILLASPQAEAPDQIRQQLLERVILRAEEIKSSFSARPVRLAADMMASQQPDIQFLLAHGFEHYESMLVMRRPASSDIPAVTALQGVDLRRWKMPAAEDQMAYIRAYNAGFPEMPKSPEALDYFLHSSAWANGTAVAAFTPQGELAGSILVYYEADQDYGIVDDVFVLPAWRGRGLAKGLIAGGLQYLREKQVEQACLEVKKSNLPAVSVYQAMGFQVINEEFMLGRYI